MVSDGNANHVSVEKSFRILKQDDRFFSRLMAKEASLANTSSRVFYYGEKSVAVPFMWEAQPGTPKHPLSETSLPSLTPPPSYYSNSKSNSKRKNTKAKVISNILTRFASSIGKTHLSPSWSWSLSTSSSSSSSSSWSMVCSSPSLSSVRDRGQGSLVSFSRSSSSISTDGSFIKHKASNGFRGCYSFGNMKRI